MSSTTAESPVVSPEQVEQYHDQGYMICENVLSPEMLEMLREECHYFVGYTDGRLDALEKQSEGITHRGKRYFIGNQYRMSHRMWKFIYSDVMAEITKATLGDDVYLFNEQWVVKGPEQGMKFAWHQDSGYVKFRDGETYHKPYLTCWVALDDIDESNGTIYVLPHDRAGTRDTIMEHKQEEKTNDLIGYTGDDPGEPVIVPAGSVVAFSSYTFHRSGSNTSDNFRRVYLAQYSSEPIINSQTGEQWSQAVPFVKDGKNVYDPKRDLDR